MNNQSSIQSLLESAWAKRRAGKYEEAGDLLKKAHQFCKEDDYNSLGRIFHIYMQFESDHKRPVKALEYCNQSLMYYNKSGNLNNIAHSSRHIADLERRLGHHEAAEHNYNIAIKIYRDQLNLNKGNLANALRGLGLLFEASGKITEARRTWNETKELYQAIHLQAGVDEASQKLELLL